MRRCGTLATRQIGCFCVALGTAGRTRSCAAVAPDVPSRKAAERHLALCGDNALMTDRDAVELHVVSDSTGETATRLVHALEAQFPDQTFEEIRHPMVSTIDDLALAVRRARGRPAVVVYTLVEPELREAMRILCRRARLHYCDLLGQPIEAVTKVSGMSAKMRAGARHPLDETYFKRMDAIEFAVKYDD